MCFDYVGFVPQVLMQFGLGQQLAGGKFDWTHIQRHMATKWPSLTLEHTCRYAELVMLQLSEPANQLPFFADGILKKDVLQNYELNKVCPVPVNPFSTLP